MKNEIKKYILPVSLFIIFILIAIAGTYQYLESKLNIEKTDFRGTYLVEPDKQHYLSLVEDGKEHSFYIFDGSDKVFSKGTYEATDNNFAVLRSEDEIVGTIVWHENSFKMVDNTNNSVISILKIAEAPIVPNENGE